MTIDEAIGLIVGDSFDEDGFVDEDGFYEEVWTEVCRLVTLAEEGVVTVRVGAAVAAGVLHQEMGVDPPEVEQAIRDYWQQHAKREPPKEEWREEGGGVYLPDCEHTRIRRDGPRVVFIDVGLFRFRIRGEPPLEGHDLIIEQRIHGGDEE